MGLMNAMRNRGGLLVGVIAFAIVAFLAGDVLISGQNIFAGSPTDIAEINGDKIAATEFQERLDAQIDQYKRSTGQDNLNEAMTGYLVDQTWNQVVLENLLKQHVRTSGVVVSTQELFDMVQGSNPHPEVRRAFTNPQTGIFDPAQVRQFLQNLDEQDPSGDTRKQWQTFQAAIKEERIRQKYLNMVKAGMYIPTAMAKAEYINKNKTATLSFVMLDYNSISDSAVQVSESDLKSYYNANKYKYKQSENMRSFEFISVDVLPSKEDSIDAKAWIDQQYIGLTTAADDSMYINLNAETKYLGNFSKRGELPGALDTIMFSKAAGFIYGPYIDAGAYKVAKLIDIKTLPDSVRARHILIPVANGDVEATKKRADSIKSALDAGANFAALAMQYSTDGSKDKGGDLGYFDNKQMVKPFSDYCFQSPKGKVGVVLSQFGYHIIEVTDQKNFNKQISVGVIDHSITPSNSTTQALFSKANGMLADVKNASDFEAIELGSGFNKRVAEDIKENDRMVSGLENPRELIRWAYKADIDDISPLFEVGNKYVFARLTKIKEKGTIPMEYLKGELEASVKKEKKAEMLLEKASAAGANDLNAYSQKLNSPVQSNVSVNFAFPIIPGVAREPMVVGKVFGAENPALLPAIKGERGVYIVKIEAINEPMPLPDYSGIKLDASGTYKSRVDGEFLEGLRKAANIRDNRARFY
jgi:peptidyl-prolyl cis-trans isomerase D